MQKGAVKCYAQKRKKFSPSISYGRYCLSLLGGPVFIYSFIYFITNSPVWGFLEKILLSSSSNLALNESNTRLNILPVYEMCHQIHTLMNVSFHSVSIPQVHRAFLKGILGFCVNPILSPFRLQGPSAWWSYGSRAWAYLEQRASFVSR